MENLNMSKEELRKFFDKYNGLELERINMMFKFVYDPEIKDARKVLTEVYSKKEKSNTFDRSYRIKELSEKELSFMYELVDTELMGLTCIKNPDSEKEIDNSTKLLNIIEYEMEKRKNKKVKVLTYK